MKRGLFLLIAFVLMGCQPHDEIYALVAHDLCAEKPHWFTPAQFPTRADCEGFIKMPDPSMEGFSDWTKQCWQATEKTMFCTPMSTEPLRVQQSFNQPKHIVKTPSGIRFFRYD
jgi:hypothetical protein